MNKEIFGFSIFTLLLFSVPIGTVGYPAYKQVQGWEAQEEKFPEGTTVTLANPDRSITPEIEYVVIENEFKYYWGGGVGKVTVVNPKENVKLQVSPDDLRIKSGTNKN